MSVIYNIKDTAKAIYGNLCTISENTFPNA